MADRKQEKSIPAVEQNMPKGNLQWHAPVLNVYNAEEAEGGPAFHHLDASSSFS
jgi:hypothetical protein